MWFQSKKTFQITVFRKLHVSLKYDYVIIFDITQPVQPAITPPLKNGKNEGNIINEAFVTRWILLTKTRWNHIIN